MTGDDTSKRKHTATQAAERSRDYRPAIWAKGVRNVAEKAVDKGKKAVNKG
jgi:type III secretion system FlhB-like substrate exporter